MRYVKILNISKNNVILEKAEIADTFLSRLKGLTGRKSIDNMSGMIILPCNSIHMIGMNFCIDAIFVDRNNRVCYIIPEMKKMAISPIIKGAGYVIEAPAGTINIQKVELNDVIELV